MKTHHRAEAAVGVRAEAFSSEDLILVILVKEQLYFFSNFGAKLLNNPFY